MYIVTNTIKVKNEYAKMIMQKFKSAHTKESMDGVTGFIDFELMYREHPEEQEISEVVVLSRWVSQEDQENWVSSDSFKGLHQKKKSQNEKVESHTQSSPIIGNSVARYHTISEQ